MKKFILTLSILLLSMGLNPHHANALLVWEWDFTPASVTVGPTDDILMYATIYNDVSSDEDIYYTSQGSNFNSTGWGPGTLPGPGVYDFIWGTAPWSILYQAGTSIGPGESLTYLFGTLDHIGAPAPIGTYYSPGWLSIAGDDVQQQFNVAVVPEPSALLLLVSGLVGLGFVRRKFKA